MEFQGPFKGELEKSAKFAEDVALKQSLNGPFFPVHLNSDEVLLLCRGVIFLTKQLEQLGKEKSDD